MSYYIVPDVEAEEMDFRIDGPYKNKDQVIDALSLIGNSAVFDSKQEAKEFIEE